MIIIAFILAVIIYIGGGWIVSDIYYSIFPIDEQMTLEEIFQTRIIIYNTVCGIASFICVILADDRYTDRIFWCIGVPFGFYLLITFLPMSAGIAWANTIACVIALTISINWALKEL